MIWDKKLKCGEFISEDLLSLNNEKINSSKLIDMDDDVIIICSKSFSQIGIHIFLHSSSSAFVSIKSHDIRCIYLHGDQFLTAENQLVLRDKYSGTEIMKYGKEHFGNDEKQFLSCVMNDKYVIGKFLFLFYFILLFNFLINLFIFVQN